MSFGNIFDYLICHSVISIISTNIIIMEKTGENGQFFCGKNYWLAEKKTSFLTIRSDEVRFFKFVQTKLKSWNYLVVKMVYVSWKSS